MKANQMVRKFQNEIKIIKPVPESNYFIVEKNFLNYMKTFLKLNSR